MEVSRDLLHKSELCLTVEVLAFVISGGWDIDCHFIKLSLIPRNDRTLCKTGKADHLHLHEDGPNEWEVGMGWPSTVFDIQKASMGYLSEPKP